MWSFRALSHQANVLQNCLRKGSWLRQPLSLFHWSLRSDPAAAEGWHLASCHRRKILRIFVFPLACALLFYFGFGNIAEPEATTSACFFSGVRLQESGGEASKGPWCFWYTFEREESGLGQPTEGLKLFPLPCVIKIVQMIFLQGAELLPSRLLPSPALSPKQILVAVAKSRQMRRGAAVLSADVLQGWSFPHSMSLRPGYVIAAFCVFFCFFSLVFCCILSSSV